jgi:hypothetical protein
LLRGSLQARDISVMRGAVGRWLRVVLVWQAVVIGASALYVAVLASHHVRGFAWVAPAIGAVFGTALPLQVAVIAMLRAGRGS